MLVHICSGSRFGCQRNACKQQTSAEDSGSRRRSRTQLACVGVWSGVCECDGGVRKSSVCAETNVTVKVSEKRRTVFIKDI